jgi:hypothetical protein
MKIYDNDYVHMTNAAINLLYFNMTLNKEWKEEQEKKNEETKKKIKSKKNHYI